MFVTHDIRFINIINIVLFNNLLLPDRCTQMLNLSVSLGKRCRRVTLSVYVESQFITTHAVEGILIKTNIYF